MDLETLRRRCIDAYVADYESHLQAFHMERIKRLTERLQEWSQIAIERSTAAFAKELKAGGKVPPEKIGGMVERFRVLESQREAYMSERMIDRRKKEGQEYIAEQVAQMRAVYEVSEVTLFLKGEKQDERKDERH